MNDLGQQGHSLTEKLPGVSCQSAVQFFNVLQGTQVGDTVLVRLQEDVECLGPNRVG